MIEDIVHVIVGYVLPVAVLFLGLSLSGIGAFNLARGVREGWPMLLSGIIVLFLLLVGLIVL